MQHTTHGSLDLLYALGSTWIFCATKAAKQTSPQLVRAECPWRGEHGGGFCHDGEASIHTLLDQGLQGDMNLTCLVQLSRCKFEIGQAANADLMPKRMVADRPSWMILFTKACFSFQTWKRTSDINACALMPKQLAMNRLLLLKVLEYHL